MPPHPLPKSSFLQPCKERVKYQTKTAQFQLDNHFRNLMWPKTCPPSVLALLERTHVCPRWYWNLGKLKLPKIQDCVELLGCFFRIFVDPLVKKLKTNMSKSIVRLDIRMSRLHIHLSKLTTGVGHTYVQATNIPLGLDIRMSNPCYQLGHTYVQPMFSAWTYTCLTWTNVCPTWQCSLT